MEKNHDAMNHHFRMAFEQMPVGLACCEMVYEEGHLKDFVCLWFNKAFNRLTGREHVVASKVGELFPDSLMGRSKLLEILGRVVSTGEPGHLETCLKTPEMWLHTSVFCPERGPYFVLMIEDMTERKRMEAEARDLSEERYRSLFDQAADGILLMSADGKTFISNRAFASMHGYTPEEIGTMKLSDLDAPETARLAPERLRQLLERKTLTFEVEHYHKDGHIFPLNVVCSVVQIDGQPFFQGFHQDITERRQAEAALLNAQRLESLGVLAGGIAHDFNNLLMSILNNVDLVMRRVTETRDRECLRSVGESINRAKDLSAQLLTFAKGGEPVRKTAPIQACLHSVAEFALSGSSVSCQFDLPDDLWPCPFDSNQIGQVTENIVMNARQAMPSGGVITVSARNIALQPGEMPMLSEGDYVRISIRDSGVGIPRDIMDRIFDPYFTTKATGSGLGLSTSFSIIKKHGGCITVESEPGRGSAFHIFLPASHDAVSPVVAETLRPVQGKGRILLMDDMDEILAVLGAGLEYDGYTVVKTRCGEEALMQFRMGLRDGERFSAAILDLTISGGMGGKETARELRKLDATLPIFVSSGYSADPIISNPREFGFTASIR